MMVQQRTGIQICIFSWTLLSYAHIFSRNATLWNRTIFIERKHCCCCIAAAPIGHNLRSPFCRPHATAGPPSNYSLSDRGACWRFTHYHSTYRLSRSGQYITAQRTTQMHTHTHIHMHRPTKLNNLIPPWTNWHPLVTRTSVSRPFSNTLQM